MNMKNSKENFDEQKLDSKLKSIESTKKFCGNLVSKEKLQTMEQLDNAKSMLEDCYSCSPKTFILASGKVMSNTDKIIKN